MDLWTILTTVARRWYLSVPMIAATVVAALMLASALTGAFTATASVLITAPNERIIEVPVDPTDPANLETVTERIIVNPLVESVGNVSTAAATLQLKLDNDQTRQEVFDLGLTADYIVEPLARNSSILVIEANGVTPEQAMDTADYLLVQVDLYLQALQDGLGAPDAARIEDEVVTEPTSAVATSSGKPRVILGIVVAGMVVTVLFVTVVDAQLTRHPRRRSGSMRLGNADGRDGSDGLNGSEVDEFGESDRHDSPDDLDHEIGDQDIRGRRGSRESSSRWARSMQAVSE